MRFLLIDRILEFESGKRLVAIKNVTLESSYLEHHFPGEPVFPGVLVIEAMAQASGYLVSCSHDESTGNSLFALMVGTNARFLKVVRPGDQLRVEVQISAHDERMARTRVSARVDGMLVARADLRFALLMRATRPDDPLRRQWNVLRVPEEQSS